MLSKTIEYERKAIALMIKPPTKKDWEAFITTSTDVYDSVADERRGHKQ